MRGQDLLMFFQKGVYIYNVLEITIFTHERKIFYFTNNGYYVIIKKINLTQLPSLQEILKQKKWVI